MDIHPALRNFSMIMLRKTVGNHEKAISIIEDVGLIPNRSSSPPICCGLPMKVVNAKSYKLGWRWRCSTKSSKKKGSKGCTNSKNPCAGTFFDGLQCRISIRDVIALIIFFALKFKVNDAFNKLINFRRLENGEEVSKSTVIDYYRHCKKIRKIVASHSYLEKDYKHDYGAQIMQFLNYIKMVYPGFVDGVQQEGLKMKEIKSFTLESEKVFVDIPSKHLPLTTIKNKKDVLHEEEIDLESSSEDPL